MIIKIQYDSKVGEDCKENGLPVVAKIIDCEEIIVFENAVAWGFTAYKDNKNMGNYEFPIDSKNKAYIMVDGKTVDTLPRR